VDAVLGGQAQRAFCAVRPPGHHAEANRAMGFCLFNNVAIGAAQAQEVHGLGRIAIVDFDVHHGNGTENMFAGKTGYLYLSSHQYPLYPGTGARSQGNIHNAPLAPYAGSEEFRYCFKHELLPVLEDFQPELIFISAGFDGHRDDPLANLCLTEADYGWVTQEIVAIAHRCCNGRVISALEGGYHLQALARSTAAHVAALR
jgi:acetoin utilization deacetylase AcuC-like enzyme